MISRGSKDLLVHTSVHQMPFAILASHQVEVLVTVAGKDISKGLQGHCNPPPELEELGIPVLVCL